MVHNYEQFDLIRVFYYNLISRFKQLPCPSGGDPFLLLANFFFLL